MKIILASASPRRLELVRQLGWEVEVCAAAFDEAATLEELCGIMAEAGLLPVNFPATPAGGRVEQSHAWDWLWPFWPDGEPDAKTLAAYNAHGKALAAKRNLKKERPELAALPLLAADTIVVHGSEVLGKPRSAACARQMLRELSGDWHSVLTGFAVFSGDLFAAGVETTRVHFRKLSEREIEDYVATGEPLDKAGAYGIQGKGAILVDRIEGSYNNVVGLPLTAVYECFKRIGVIV